MRQRRMIEIEVDNERYEGLCDIIYHTDKEYGADADGNRGIEREFVDEVFILDVSKEDADCGMEHIIRPSEWIKARIMNQAVYEFYNNVN